jgi:hypothetical protein
MNNIKAAVAAIAIAAGISGLAACGSHPTGIIQSQVSSQASAAARAAASRQAASDMASAAASQAAAAKASQAVANQATAAASAVPGAAPVYTPPIQTDPWAVLNGYYGDIESDNYSAAWNLLSPSMQAQYGPYYSWAAGYANTGAQTLTENWESSGEVSANIAAVETATGDTQYFSGSWTVENGLITSASVTQTG